MALQKSKYFIYLRLNLGHSPLSRKQFCEIPDGLGVLDSLLCFVFVLLYLQTVGGLESGLSEKLRALEQHSSQLYMWITEMLSKNFGKGPNSEG